jgi:threonine dehydrogenase-like Zn-dependent dehydrogenase
MFAAYRGAGPVGLLTIMWAKYRGAKRIFVIDCIPERLEKARSQGAETIDFSKANVVETMQKLIPGKLLQFVLSMLYLFVVYRWS